MDAMSPERNEPRVSDAELQAEAINALHWISAGRTATREQRLALDLLDDRARNRELVEACRGALPGNMVTARSKGATLAEANMIEHGIWTRLRAALADAETGDSE